MSNRANHVLLPAGMSLEAGGWLEIDRSITARNFAPAPAKRWFVDKAVTASNGGKTWAKAFKTITEALAAAGDYDQIYIKTGVYDEGAALTIDHAGLKMIGVMSSGYYWGQPSIKGSSATHTLINIAANQVEIAGIGFTQTKAAKIIEVAPTADQWRAHIHDCYFGGNDTATYGVYAGATYDAVCTVIERCMFRNIATAGVRLYGSFSHIQNNFFDITTAAGIGIEYPANGGDRPSCFIVDNRFKTTDATNAIGIKVTNTPTAGTVMFDGNRFINFADNNHCISTRTGYTGLNYLGVTAIAIT